MNSRERILMTLEHKTPDRVPYDLSGTHVSGIHLNACRNLCDKLGINNNDLKFTDVIQQTVIPPEELYQYLKVDTRGLYPLTSHNWNIKENDIGEYYEYVDEWGLVQHKPKENGFWWSLSKSPLDSFEVTDEQMSRFHWPEAALQERIKGLKAQAQQFREDGKIVMIKGLCAGVFEMGQRIRGMENFLCDLLSEPDKAANLLDKILALKIQFWDMALDELGELVDIVVETDDYGTQDSQLISHECFSELIKPRISELVSFVKNKLKEKKVNDEKGYFFFHSCGNVRPFLPDFIEMGIDIINPVHISAKGMDPFELKKDFGDDIVFWGGGVETQKVLPTGSANDIRENVKINLEALMPGGGFVFNTVHNIMGEVPPENIITMREALEEFGVY